VCEGVECFELDSAGNHTPLQPFQTHSESENDQQLVKDVTDAFQSKVLFMSSLLIDICLAPGTTEQTRGS
jgi:hypothetical protein